jgi:hypothetical protein
VLQRLPRALIDEGECLNATAALTLLSRVLTFETRAPPFDVAVVHELAGIVAEGGMLRTKSAFPD